MYIQVESSLQEQRWRIHVKLDPYLDGKRSGIHVELLCAAVSLSVERCNRALRPPVFMVVAFSAYKIHTQNETPTPPVDQANTYA